MANFVRKMTNYLRSSSGEEKEAEHMPKLNTNVLSGEEKQAEHTLRPNTNVQKITYSEALELNKNMDIEAFKSQALTHQDTEIDFDPSQSKYFQSFMADPDESNSERQKMRDKAMREMGQQKFMKIVYGKKHHPLKKYRRYDFRMNDTELDIFRSRGFVVSERLGCDSFAEAYYRIYTDDLPVFISADSILHAWHKTYDGILESVELDFCIPTVQSILGGMLKSLCALVCSEELCASRNDADIFLSVATSLLAGSHTPTEFNNDEKVNEIIQAIESEQIMQMNLFGKSREVDFSQFKPRGHYATCAQLQKYFKCMMWLGRIDLRVAGEESSPIQLGCAIILLESLLKSNMLSTWQKFNSFLQVFIGEADSMTFIQLHEFLQTQNLDQIKLGNLTLAALFDLQNMILESKLGLQQIRGDIYYTTPGATSPRSIPRSFSMMGQRFSVDSWLFSKVVYDDIVYDGISVPRRIPSCLDVAYGVFGNSNVAKELVRRLEDSNGMQFRDGLPYHQNLLSAKQAIDSQTEDEWSKSLYSMWLALLRELSQPAAHGSSTFHTESWQMKDLNTQLASWTQLRHDTILYVKQSYTCSTCCEYPAGFVEPRPVFWSKFQDMVRKAKDTLSNLGLRIDLRVFDSFLAALNNLENISIKQAGNSSLSIQEESFLKTVMEERHGSGGTRYLGWYPRLFYGEPEDSGKWDPIVVDVHTDTPDNTFGDPGCVLHEGVGNVFMAMLAVQTSSGPSMYAGPVLSHYEFTTPNAERKNDQEWRADIKNKSMQEHPEWTKTYLVPGEIPNVQHFWHEDDMETSPW